MICSSVDQNFYSSIQKIIRLDEYNWSEYILSKGSLYKKMDSGQSRYIIQNSLLCAEEQYTALKKTFGNLLPRDYASAKSVGVIYDETPLSEGFLRLAFYSQDPPCIEISAQAVERIEKMIAYEKLDTLLGEVDLRQLIVAHELFHHVEQRNPDIFTRRSNVVLKRFRRFRYQAHSTAASEIAAVHFSKILLGLDYCPAVFEVLLAYSVNRERARNIVRQLKEK